MSTFIIRARLNRRFAQLQELDLDGVEPSIRAGQEENFFRDDVPIVCEGRCVQRGTVSVTDSFLLGVVLGRLNLRSLYL